MANSRSRFYHWFISNDNWIGDNFTVIIALSGWHVPDVYKC